VRSSIALTGQYAAVDEQLTGGRTSSWSPAAARPAAGGAKRRAVTLLGEFGLDGAAGRAVRTYHGGMRRRLDLAASLVGRPDVLFLDEPTTGLDPRAGRALEVIRSHVRGGVRCADHAVPGGGRCARRRDRRRRPRAGGRDGTPTNELKNRIGGQVLEVLLPPADDADVVARVLAEERPAFHAEGHAGTLRVPAPSPASRRPCCVGLSEDGVELAELSLRRPSLDEVFLSLTAGAESTGDTSDTTRRSACTTTADVGTEAAAVAPGGTTTGALPGRVSPVGCRPAHDDDRVAQLVQIRHNPMELGDLKPAAVDVRRAVRVRARRRYRRLAEGLPAVRAGRDHHAERPVPHVEHRGRDQSPI
jgi:hypothetical protein